MTRTCDNCTEQTTDATMARCTTCACALPIQTDDSRPASGSEASDTPETDNALQGVWYRGDHGSAIPALCRKLERERNGARSKQLRSLDGSSGSLRWVRYPASGLYVSGEWEIHNSASEGSRTGPFMLLKGGKLIGSFDRLREAKRRAGTGELSERIQQANIAGLIDDFGWASDAAAMEDQIAAVKAALREYHCGIDTGGNEIIWGQSLRHMVESALGEAKPTGTGAES